MMGFLFLCIFWLLFNATLLAWDARHGHWWLAGANAVCVVLMLVATRNIICAIKVRRRTVKMLDECVAMINRKGRAG